jgi:hypothetical protein
MAAYSYVQVAPNSTGKLVDTAELTNGVNLVERQIAVIGDPVNAANVAFVDSTGYLYVNVRGVGGATPVGVTPTPAGSAFVALPAPTTNGAPLSSGIIGTEISVAPGASVTYTIAAAQPVSAPTLVRTTANPISSVSWITDQISLAAGVQVYVTASSGTLLYRVV